jgi:hypothetical protein
MRRDIEDIIRYDSENHSLDFKEAQYPLGKHDKKNELLKDISAMANHPSDDDKFIVIGVKEANGIAIGFNNIEDLTDEAKYQQFVNANIEPEINFEYKRLAYNGHNLAYFRIYGNENRPYLFKKDLNDEYRAGDGYIRRGTSTKKLTRTDLDSIYKNRHSSRDRRSDLKITPRIFKSPDDEIGWHDLDCFDIDIENRSTKSIDLDLEIKIMRSSNLRIVLDSELKKELQKQRKEGLFPSPIPFNFDVTIEEKESYVLAMRNKRRGERTAISISQHAKEADSFCQSLIILSDGKAQLKGEVIIRSDDFSEGPLIFPFFIDYLNET